MKVKIFYDEVKVVETDVNAWMQTNKDISILGSTGVPFPSDQESTPDYLCIIIWYKPAKQQIPPSTKRELKRKFP